VPRRRGGKKKWAKKRKQRLLTKRELQGLRAPTSTLKRRLARGKNRRPIWILFTGRGNPRLITKEGPLQEKKEELNCLEDRYPRKRAIVEHEGWNFGKGACELNSRWPAELRKGGRRRKEWKGIGRRPRSSAVVGERKLIGYQVSQSSTQFTWAIGGGKHILRAGSPSRQGKIYYWDHDDGKVGRAVPKKSQT